jgi:hypothetical protein
MMVMAVADIIVGMTMPSGGAMGMVTTMIVIIIVVGVTITIGAAAGGIAIIAAADRSPPVIRRLFPPEAWCQRGSLVLSVPR